MSKKYKVTYTSGGGTEYDDGVWERKDTPKTITVTKISDEGLAIYTMHEIGEKIKIGPQTGNTLDDHGDETFTVYFKRAGTPYYFEPLAP